MGSFTWDTIAGNNLTATMTASPSNSKRTSAGSPVSSAVANGVQASRLAPRARALVSLPEDYKLFIKSIRNLITREMLLNGSIPLGEFFITPSSDDNHLSLFAGSGRRRTTTVPPMTVVGCAYSTYITGTDLVFRPYTRRLRLRPLTANDADNDGLKIITSPAGENASIVSCISEISEQAQEEVLREWSSLYNIPIQYLRRHHYHHPTLVTIRTKSNATVLYPSALVFVPTSIRSSSTRTAGMDGIFGFNRGLTNDIGSHWSRWAWIERLKESGQEIEEDCRVNFWRLPDMTSRVLEALDTANVTQQYTAFKMPDQQTSPAVDSSNSGGIQDVNNQTPPSNSATTTRDASFITTIGGTKTGTNTHLDFLMEFLSNACNSSMEEGSVEDIPEATPGLSEASASQLAPMNNVPEALVTTHDPIEPLNADDFGLSYDNMFTPNDQMCWGNGPTNDNLESFDFDVTDADFEYFETAKGDSAKKSLGMDVDAPLPSRTSAAAAAAADVLLEDAFEIQGLADNTAAEARPSAVGEEAQYHTGASHLISLASPIESDVTAVASSSDAGGSTAVPYTVDTAASFDSRIPHIVLERTANAAENPYRTIPRGFSPVRIIGGVDDTKYMYGGKFMYSPASDSSDAGAKAAREANIYRPDYIPKSVLASKDEQDKAESNPTYMSTSHEEGDNSPSEDGDRSDSSSDSSSDSDNDSDSDSDSDASSSSSSDKSSHNGSQRSQDNPLMRIQSAQMAHVRRLLGDIRNKPKRRRVMNLATDYDSAFAPSVMDIIAPEKLTLEDMSSLELLCRQTVWGGYPFSGAMPESMARQTEGIFFNENAESIIARYTGLIQSIRGDITHVPCLATTTGHVLNEFKTLLQRIFGQPAMEEGNDVDMIEDMSPAGSQSIIPSIGVKGPLRVQEYYQLLETAQTHSRYYGKFQVKKKRPNEPELFVLGPPDIAVGRNGDWIEGSPSLVQLWEKEGLEPYSYRNNVIYFVVYPESLEFGKSLAVFLNGLSTAYEVCNLGTHRPGNIGHYQQGAVPVPAALCPWKEGYRTTCESLGTALGQADLLAQDENATNIVIYLINPSTHLSSNLELSRCFRRFVSAYNTSNANLQSSRASKKHIPSSGLTMQIIPAEHVIRLDTTNTLQIYKDIAFSVHSQCHTMLERKNQLNSSHDISSIYSPAWVIAKHVPETIRLSLKRPPNAYSDVTVDPNTMLHMAYSFSLDRRWMVIAWTDHRGELIEFAVLEIPPISSKTPWVSPLVKVFTEAWTRTTKIAKRTNFRWQYAIAKVGLIFDSEIQVWEDVFSTAGDIDKAISIVCIDLDSSLYVDTILSGSSRLSAFNADEGGSQAMSDLSESYTYTSSQPSTGSNTTSKPLSAVSVGPNKTCMILLNHRVAYSRQRVNIYQGDLSMDSMNELDKWILALSTGYLIKQNTSQEGIDDHPLVIEIHLVYNKNSRTSRSILRQIIKQYDALSYVNHPPSSVSANSSLLPTHLAVVERLSRILLAVGS
ncbi:mediator complex subunit 13 C-terminal-domain-containing protein [Dichotomocladium elegans]|nr:mediator complex subunit 13 C-terminal-domain-containing protein [Dichotomocladium elegans]